MRYIHLVLILAIIVFSCSSTRKIHTGSIMDMNSDSFLVKNNVWNLQSTNNFKFYFDKAISESLKDSVKQIQEFNFNRINTLMGNPVKKDSVKPVNFWLFKSREQKTKLTAVNSDAHALSPYNSIYQIPENAFGGQELGHVLTQRAWGFIPKTSNYSLLLDERFNYYIDEQFFYSFDLNDAAKKICAKTKLTPLMLANRNNGEKSYGVAQGGNRRHESIVSGSFVKYLIKQHGIDKFSQLWIKATTNKTDDLEIFQEIYSKSIKELSNEYMESL